MKTLVAFFLLTSIVFNVQSQDLLETVKLTDSIYVFKPKLDWINSNCTAIITREGVFIIDTFLMTNYAYEAIRKLKGITPLPVKFIFNTHGHADHVMGNSIFKEKFPDCKIIMNDSTYQKYPGNFTYGGIKTFQADLESTEKELKEGKTGTGLELTGSMKEFWAAYVADMREYVRVYKPVKPANGDIVFDHQLTIHFGGRDIIMMPMKGAGHDKGDAMAWLPKEKIALVGDVVVGPTPYAIRGRVDEMIESLQYIIIDINPLIVIPGHGEVMKGLDYVKREKVLFETVQQKTLDAIARGVSRADAGKEIKIPADLEKQFTNGDPTREWAMQSFFTGWTIGGTYKKKGAK